MLISMFNVYRDMGKLRSNTKISPFFVHTTEYKLKNLCLPNVSHREKF